MTPERRQAMALITEVMSDLASEYVSPAAKVNIDKLREALALLLAETPEGRQQEIALTFDEWALVKLDADRRMKRNNGHVFITILKTRCQHCGRSPQAKGRCRAWFQTFVGHLDVLLMNLDRERDAGLLSSEARR